MAPLNSLVSILLRRANLTPFDDAATSIITTHSLVARDDAPESNDNVHFGVGATPAATFNNQGFLALFAILGAGMALVAIWFFFWAKNGGFKWRQGDWDDYKSTVLRRKGPDGKTLSNATKSTKLGGGSIVGASKSEYSDDSASTALTDDRDIERGDYAHEGHRATRDPELAHYRSERPARVGGMNRNHDGSHWDSSNTDRSAVSSDRDRKDKERKRRSRRREERERERHRESSRGGGAGRGSQRPPEMESLSSSYYSAYRPEGAPTYRDDSDAGTKSYPCRIPGLSASTVSVEDDIAPGESVSNVGVGTRRPPQSHGASGFRRQGGMRIVRDEDGY